MRRQSSSEAQIAVEPDEGVFVHPRLECLGCGQRFAFHVFPFHDYDYITVTKVVYRIQSHPSRRAVRQRLIDGLPSCDIEVIEHESDPPSPWAGYKECLRSISGAENEITHAVILQDDSIACRNLPLAVNRIIEVIPDSPVCLFMPMVSATRRNATLAARQGQCFVEVIHRGFMPVVAVIWPRDKAEGFLEWSSTHQSLRRGNGQRIEHRSDDAMAHLWLRTKREKAFATIPSLVQHPDDVPSTISRSGGGRTAMFWHGHNWDPLSIEWKL